MPIAALIGFHAYQSCKLSEFTKNTYPHFIEIAPDVAMEELVRMSEALDLYDYEIEGE